MTRLIHDITESQHSFTKRSTFFRSNVICLAHILHRVTTREIQLGAFCSVDLTSFCQTNKTFLLLMSMEPTVCEVLHVTHHGT
uniref:Uncharacterized protein n=1 Tax=Ciona intestinalis TaxID=7719 RepID=H2XK41_CIOIN